MFASVKADYVNNKYPIYISDQLISNLISFLKNFDKSSVFVIADNYFKNKSINKDINLNEIFHTYNHTFINGGIESKNFTNVLKICEELNKKKINKDGCIVSIGGGVIGDLGALVASIYKRGLNLVHVPTTITSMVDSAIGGKTGINLFNNVNLIGTYYHPISTFIDLRFLNYLSERDLSSGIAESIKKAIIYDKNFYKYIVNNSKHILERKFLNMFELIKKSIEIKLLLTTSDEKEKSSRLLLNYGHTFGQAIETEYGINENKLKHGEAVSLGMICAAKLSELLFGKSVLIEHRDILKAFNLPLKIKDCNNIDYQPNILNLINNIQNDKKKTSKGNRFIICKKVGNGSVEYISNNKLIRESFNMVLD